MKKSLLYFLFCLYSFSASSNEPLNANQNDQQKGQIPVVRQEEFKPYMLGHIYEGCPSNSICNKFTGEKRKKWIDVLSNAPENKVKAAKGLEKFRQTYGIPLGFWIHRTLPPTTNNDIPDNLVTWDSHCPNHQPKDEIKKISLGEVMLADFDKLMALNIPGYQLMINKTWTLVNGKIESFPHPRGDFPIFLDNSGIYFILEEEGKYFGLKINNKGKNNIVPIEFPETFPTEVDCPKELEEQFKKNVMLPNLYMGHYCKELWNKETKKTQTFIFGWSCN